jgi:hypothetical protein
MAQQDHGAGNNVPSVPAQVVRAGRHAYVCITFMSDLVPADGIDPDMRWY